MSKTLEFTTLFQIAALAANHDPQRTIQFVTNYIMATTHQPPYLKFSGAYGTQSHAPLQKLEK